MLSKARWIISKALKILLNPAALRNCTIDSTSKVCSRSELTGVNINKYSYVGNQCFIVDAQIGSFCSIADRCCMGGAEHPLDRVSSSPVFHSGKNVLKKNFAVFLDTESRRIYIENDVWIGMGCYIKGGVTIHNGAVVGMGSIVTKDIPAYEIWAGNPARKIGERTNRFNAELMESIAWWDWDDKKIQEQSKLFDDIEQFIKKN